jgi:hypothetical protein
MEIAPFEYENDNDYEFINKIIMIPNSDGILNSLASIK